MKTLKIIGKCLLWILYLMLTGKERQKYQYAKYRNVEVLDVNNNLFGSTYTLGKRLQSNQLPTRDYLNWKEFRKIHNF